MLAKEWDIPYFCRTSVGSGKLIAETHGTWRLVFSRHFYFKKNGGTLAPYNLKLISFCIFTD